MYHLIKSEMPRPLEYSAEVQSDRFRPWSPVPGNPFLNDEVKERQRAVNERIDQLFMLPPKDQFVPDSFRDMLFDDHVISFQRRNMLNFNRFSEWRVGVDPSRMSQESCRVEDGSATVMDTLTHLHITSTESGEVGKTTHPYSQGIEHIADFRQEVTDSITALGGIVTPSIQGYRSIDITPKYHRDDDNKIVVLGLIANYKHDIGTIPATQKDQLVTIVERQIAGYRVDEAAGFDQDIAANLATELDKFDNFVYDNTTEYDIVLAKILESTGCRDYVERIIQSDALEPFVVPVSTTIYGFRGQQKQPTVTLNPKAINVHGMVFLDPAVKAQ